jgi:hypothetical protein
MFTTTPADDRAMYILDPDFSETAIGLDTPLATSWLQQENQRVRFRVADKNIHLV